MTPDKRHIEVDFYSLHMQGSYYNPIWGTSEDGRTRSYEARALSKHRLGWGAFIVYGHTHLDFVASLI